MGSHRRTLAAAVAVMLASFSLYPIFTGMAWFWAGVGAVLTVALAGTLTRLRRLPVPVCLLAGLAGLLLYLNVGFENARCWYHLLPTPNSLRLLWDLAGTGFSESAKYAPPVPELPGMLMLATAGIGLTALLTDLIAVRLESAALAGLPLLLLYTEPFTLSVARSGLGTMIVFCIGTAGYLALLSSEGKDRIKEWERPNPGPDEIPDVRALATTGRRVGLASVVLALCVPLFIPGLHATRLFGGQPGIGGVPGAGGVGFPNPVTQLSSELHESKASTVLTYTSSSPQYLQIYVLDKLTAKSGWQLFSQPVSLAAVSPLMPPAPGVTSEANAIPETTTVALSKTVGQDDLAALPVPYPATSIDGPGTLQADKNSLMLFDAGVSLSGLRYVVTSLGESPPRAVLDAAPRAPASITSHYLEVPSSYTPLLALADSVVRQAKASTPFEKAVALQDWLSGGEFKYTLNAPTIVDARGLTNFLTTTRKGYCQQFSFAMAVLARLLGIPSRVAYGYTSGTQGSVGTWLVTTHDAHAWPELFFQGAGWLRFEPTPQGQGGQGTATAPAYTQTPVNPFTPTTPANASPGQGAASNPGAGNLNNPALREHLNFPNGDSGAVTLPGQGGLSAWDVFLLALLALLGLLMVVSAAPTCVRLLIRRRRWRAGGRGADAGLAHAAWRELRDDLVDYRAGYLPSESPRALAARVGADLELTGPARAALGRVAMAEERARYATRPDPGAGLRHDSAVVRHAIAAAVPRRSRWLGRLVPSSVLSPVMFRIAQVSDFSGRLNTGWLGAGGLGGARLRRTGFGRGRPGSDHPGGDRPGGEGAAGSEPPVGAGARHG